ncbi:30S ribosomal protein S3 [Ignicoccus hospitalis]|uniref:Small ribosomal subunit protein uS3 n=1 Tax=Ignicoccus hospitalis (strain KIN4/I / DSM 18386 / JCM 14125) TaxID=453591 RepID=RS3_IGNH4|nr:RecName: Full=Small ribosomal subunit protein uS3; AltName: Full=30S ribosomal protein S3 [Ignicoccus hospitalis KIN4/I]ABU81772.1 SSU ribosomal protein S3P [Ignicoccus hospitalis KIN4/I]HIH90040.1 30S ribosomal protein S3 [Desulfurococcaceae archaeon]
MSVAKKNIKKYFLEQALTQVKVDEYLAYKFHSVGYSKVELQKTPMGTRVIIYAERSGAIIGRRGQTIKQITKVLEEWFGIPNPQVTVVKVEEPELDARVMAFRLANALQRGFHFRRAAYTTLRRIMGAGAIGAQVKVSGKLRGERARFEKYIAGKVYKSGNQVVRLTDRAIAHVLLKVGVEGVEVIISKKSEEERPDDEVRIKSPEEVNEIVQKIREEMQQTQPEAPTLEETVEQSGGETQ